MKKCIELIKAVKEVCQQPDLMVSLQKAEVLSNYNKSVNKLDQIELNLKDCKY